MRSRRSGLSKTGLRRPAGTRLLPGSPAPSRAGGNGPTFEGLDRFADVRLERAADPGRVVEHDLHRPPFRHASSGALVAQQVLEHERGSAESGRADVAVEIVLECRG